MAIKGYGVVYSLSSGKGDVRLDLENGDSVFLRNLPASKFDVIQSLLNTKNKVYWDGVSLSVNC